MIRSDTDLGELLDHPIEAVALGDRGSNRALHRLCLADLFADGSQGAPSYLGAPPASLAVAYRHRLAIAKAQDAKEVVGVIGLGYGG